MEAAIAFISGRRNGADQPACPIFNFETNLIGLRGKIVIQNGAVWRISSGEFRIAATRARGAHGVTQCRPNREEFRVLCAGNLLDRSSVIQNVKAPAMGGQQDVVPAGLQEDIANGDVGKIAQIESRPMGAGVE